jgi:tetratricopeptide (TPR) repeat protein
MQRAGDEGAQRIFKAHYQLLRDAVSANGGAEVKSLGDGLMVAFPSTADAVRCAITMQQASRRPVNGERLAIKVGINAGDALRDEGDYFGTAVVTARRLCDRAGPGQILCSAVIEGLLAGRQAFSFRDLGELELKGLSAPVATREVIYETEQPGLMLNRTPFVGREGEVSRIKAKLADARSDRGGLVMLVGEPGIGKSRLIEEFTEHARSDGAAVLFGACFEGEWVPPFAPFADAIDNYAKEADVEALQADLGHGAAAIARLAPSLRERLPDVGEPAPLQPDEERFRLLDAVSQFLIATSERVPVVLVLDDLHWADKGTIAMLRHVARFVTKQRILLLGAYRDVELDRQHPLSDALAALRREVEYERISLKGLEERDIGAMLTSITEHDVPEAFVHAISAETDGNPFFVREVLIHLAEEGKIFEQDGQWTSNATSIAELGIPEGVRQVITRRLSRLSDDANKLMTAASGFNGGFNFLTLSLVSGLTEAATLDAVDEALTAQLLRPTGQPDHYTFTHALIRHTLYGEMNPSRQVRLHRRIAEAYEERNQDEAAMARHAAEMAYQYHRSAAIAGAERGVPYALAAADQAEAAAAWDEQVAFLRMALELLPEGDARRPRLLGRFAIALAWTLRFDESVANAIDAAAAIAVGDGEQAAAEFLADAAMGLNGAGSLRAAWRLAEAGLPYARQRDRTWCRLVWFDVQRREAFNPDRVGTSMPQDAPEYDEFVAAVSKLSIVERPVPLHKDREEVLLRAAAGPASSASPIAIGSGFLLGWRAGEFRRARDWFQRDAADAVASGRVAQSAGGYAMLARCHNALGDLDAARNAYQRSLAQARRLAGDPLLGAQSIPAQQVIAALDELRLADGTEAAESVALARNLLAQSEPEVQWARASLDAAVARIFAMAGHVDDALEVLEALAPRLDRIPAWDVNNVRGVCDAAHALWALERTDHLAIIERNLREKIIAPDFRYPMFDGRLALARLCALSGRYDEAGKWFAEARTVLEEAGARPLRAIVDYDEALMFARRNAEGDKERARPLLDAALAQFREIGMTGWVRLAEELQQQIAAGGGAPTDYGHRSRLT